MATTDFKQTRQRTDYVVAVGDGHADLLAVTSTLEEAHDAVRAWADDNNVEALLFSGFMPDEERDGRADVSVVLSASMEGHEAVPTPVFIWRVRCVADVRVKEGCVVANVAQVRS